MTDAQKARYLAAARPFWPDMPAYVNVIEVPYFPWLVNVPAKGPSFVVGVNTEAPETFTAYDELLEGRRFAGGDLGHVWMDYGPRTNTLAICFRGKRP